MKNSIVILLTLGFFTSFTACKDKTEPIPGINFDITFKALYDSNQLVTNKDYIFGSFPIHFVSYRLYLSDLTLLKADGSEFRISEVEYLDFTPDSEPTDSSVTPKITFKNVPEDMYTGIRLGFGVKPNLNSKDPSDFPSGHPLNIETDFWAAWKSYIFMVLDGKADPEVDGTKNLGFSYHCGSDAVYRTYTFNEHIHVEQGHGGIGIEFDVRKLLTNDDGSMYDLETNPVTSNSVNDSRVSKFVMENYAKATTIKQ